MSGNTIQWAQMVLCNEDKFSYKMKQWNNSTALVHHTVALNSKISFIQRNSYFVR